MRFSAPGACISNQSSLTQRLTLPAAVRSTGIYRRLNAKLHRKTVRRRAVRWGLLLINVAALVVILAFVLQNPHDTTAVKSTGLSSVTTNTAVSNPVDQLSSATIALTIARLNNLPERTAISNTAESQAADLAITSTTSSVLNKPQVVSTALKSRADIQTYVVKAGDNIGSVATQFGVTSDSIRWSNNLTGNNLTAGNKLLIPPVAGIVYTVKSGDTVDSLATKYRANRDQIVAYNDAEISGLKVGEQIIIPNGTVVAPAASSSYATYGGGFAWGASPIYGYNGYDYGYCTWWVANRRVQVGKPLPSNLGNASSWPFLARLAGLAEGHTPALYAAAVTSTRGEGHVVFVESVNADGSIVISEMNHLGWAVKDTQTIPASTAAGYIYIY